MGVQYEGLPQVRNILHEELEDYVSKAVIGDVFYTSINMGYYTDHYMCYCTEEIINGSKRPCWLKMVER